MAVIEVVGRVRPGIPGLHLSALLDAVPWHALLHVAVLLCEVALPLAAVVVVLVMYRLRRGPVG